MTTKEIAFAVGKPEKTVRTWANKASAKTAVAAAKLAEGTPSKPADWDLEETISIIEIGMGKNAADLFRMNAGQNVTTPRQNVVQADLAALIAPIVAETIKQLLPLIQGASKPAPMQITEAPELSLRDQFRMIVDGAARESGDYAGTYNRVYNEIRYRLHINVTERAKKAGVSKIEILEAEGHLLNAILIARDIFK